MSATRGTPWRGTEAEAEGWVQRDPAEGDTLEALLRRAVARGVRIADARHCRPAVHRWRDTEPGDAVVEQTLADAIEAGDVEA